MRNCNISIRLKLVALAMLLAVPTIMAYTFEEGGIYYNDYGFNKVQVTFSDESFNSYSGDVNIPSTVTHGGDTYFVCGIESKAFYNCSGLTSVKIPTMVTAIGDDAFSYCRALSSVVIGYIDGSSIAVDKICGRWESAFGLAGGNEYIIDGADIVQFEFYANNTGRYFYKLYNTQVYVDLNWQIQGNRLDITYYDGDYDKLYYRFDEKGYLVLSQTSSFDNYTAYRPTGITSIGSHAFHECENLTNLDFGDNVLSVGDYAFFKCMSLTKLNIPNTVETIGNCAFLQCQNLTQMTIGNGVKSIGYGAFGAAWQLDSITCNAATPPSFAVNENWATFNNNVYDDATLFVPKASIDQYRTAYIWKDFVNIKAIPEQIPGDVNGDGEVNIADVNAVINVILGYAGNPSADVNGDGEVNIADVNAIINIILYGAAPAQNHEYVDLGLSSGTLWATCNVGANSPEEYGDYFAWGETGPNDNYDWTTYKWCIGSNNTQTKYCIHSFYGNEDFTDDKTELDPEDDAAYVNWGAQWRMPTMEQQKELVENCTWQWTQRNGVYGHLATGPNGNTLFLPASGRYWYGSFDFAGSRGDYWSRTLDPERSDCAYFMYFNSEDVVCGYCDYRCLGFAVRAVRVP